MNNMEEEYNIVFDEESIKSLTKKFSSKVITIGATNDFPKYILDELEEGQRQEKIRFREERLKKLLDK